MTENGGEKKNSEEAAKKALDTFQAMFRGQRDIEHLLISNPENSVLKSLLSSAEKKRSKVANGRKVTSGLEDCSALLMGLTSEQTSQPTSARAPADWPYISKIKLVTTPESIDREFSRHLLTITEYF